jgi:DNA-binding transcriptional MerR regulator
MPLLPIGRFARLAQVPVTTLRHWAELGVLEPARCDAGSGYRYYSAGQLPLATTVRLLRALEVPLEEVAALLAAGPAATAAAVEVRAAELARRAERQQAIAVGLAERLRAGPPDPASDEPGVVEVADRAVLARRAQLGVAQLSPWLGRAFAELAGEARRRGGGVVGPPLTVFHTPVDDERTGEVEACLPVSGPGDRVLRGGPAAVVHARGEDAGYPRLLDVYERLAGWVAEHDRELGDPPYEVYHSDPAGPVEHRHVEVVWPLAGPA